MLRSVVVLVQRRGGSFVRLGHLPRQKMEEGRLAANEDDRTDRSLTADGVAPQIDVRIEVEPEHLVLSRPWMNYAFEPARRPLPRSPAKLARETRMYDRLEM